MRTMLSMSLLSVLTLAGACAGRDRALEAAAGAFSAADYRQARRSLRAEAYREPAHENTVLDSAALGMAALADGSTFEANRALMRAYELMETGNLNDDARLFAASVINEGVTIAKGEPFEQAIAYHALAVSAALQGDWENVRIASRASTRRLRDYADARGEEPVPPETVAKDLADQGVRDDEASFTVADTDFALSYLLEAIADNAIGRASNAIDLAKAADARVTPLADDIARAQYNTVVIVHLGMGPVKEPTGPHGESTLWAPREPNDPGPMFITFNGWQASPGVRPVTNVNRMSRDHRWINFESIRRLKALIGEGLVIGGAVTAATGDNDTNDLIGAAMLITGILLQASSAADTRHNPLLPAAVYLAVIDLPPTTGSLQLHLPERNLPPMIVPDVTAGSLRNPTVIYLRLTGREPASWYAADYALFTSDASPPNAGDYPWILGGRDVSTPSDAVLAAYHAGGHLLDLSVLELEELYRQEGIQIGEGPTTPDDRRHASYQHILEGGSALFTPHPYTMGYKRLICMPHPPYIPKSERVRALAEQIRARTH